MSVNIFIVDLRPDLPPEISCQSTKFQKVPLSVTSKNMLVMEANSPKLLVLS